MKQKRSVVKPVVAELRRRFEVSVAEAGHQDLHRRALIGVAVVAADASHVRDLLDACERLVAGRPELELLSARRRLLGPDDD
ncbi:YlxP-like protein [Alloactinosynnema sp. L-07]|nr:YlxP-like protein [Alloactinosynnema sp. L-07]